MNSFVDIASSTLRKYFTKDYSSRFLKALISNKIIIRSPYFNDAAGDRFDGKTPSKNKPFGYRINESLFDFSTVDYVEIDKKRVTARKKQEKGVIRDLNRLEADIDGMMDFVNKYRLDDEITVIDDLYDDDIELYTKDKDGNPKIYKLKSSDALAIAKEKDKDLLLYKGKYYISKVNDFKRFKLNNFKASQMYSIVSIKNQDYYASISSTNGRLNTTISNLKTEFIENGYVKLDGETLAEIDMSNSQPCFLSYFLKDMIRVCETFPIIPANYQIPNFDTTSTTFAIFKQKAGEGLLYDYISEKTGMDRSTAKSLFIKTLFSKPTFSNTKKIRELFPDVISWVNQFKVVNGCHKKMAIMLQQLESEIFIQNIFKTLKKDGYTVYTKHDSILCKTSEKDEVQKRIEGILDGYGLKYRLK